MRLASLLIIFTACICSGVAAASSKTYKFSYEWFLPPHNPSQSKNGMVEIFVPVAITDQHQTVHSVRIGSSHPQLIKAGRYDTEQTHGNRFWHLTLAKLPPKEVSFIFQYEIERRGDNRPDLTPAINQTYSPSDLLDNELYLRSDARLGPQVAALGDTPVKTKTPLQIAEATFNHVVETQDYTPQPPKQSSCRGFHDLFTSMARSQQIPTKVDMGFTIPQKSPAGEITNYHCWVEFYLPKIGWRPADAALTKKAMANTILFGYLPPDRIRFSTGRNITLNSYQKAPPLREFIFPHVEVGGKTIPKIKTKFSYQEIKSYSH